MSRGRSQSSQMAFSYIRRCRFVCSTLFMFKVQHHVRPITKLLKIIINVLWWTQSRTILYSASLLILLRVDGLPPTNSRWATTDELTLGYHRRTHVGLPPTNSRWATTDELTLGYHRRTHVGLPPTNSRWATTDELTLGYHRGTHVGLPPTNSRWATTDELTLGYHRRTHVGLPPTNSRWATTDELTLGYHRRTHDGLSPTNSRWLVIVIWFFLYWYSQLTI